MELNWYFVETVLSGSNLYFEDMQNEKKTMWAAQLFGARHATSPASARPKENGSCLDRLYLVVANVVKEGGWGKIPKYWVIHCAAKIYWVGGKVATLMFTIRQSRGCSDIQSVNLITDKMGLTATLPPGFTPPGLLMSLLNCECWQPVPMLNNLLYWCLSWLINSSGAQVLRSEYLRLVFASVRNLFNVLFAF